MEETSCANKYSGEIVFHRQDIEVAHKNTLIV